MYTLTIMFVIVIVIGKPIFDLFQNGSIMYVIRDALLWLSMSFFYLIDIVKSKFIP